MISCVTRSPSHKQSTPIRQPKFWIQTGTILAVLVFLILYRQPVWALLRLVGNRDAVSIYLDELGILAPLFLGIVLVLQVIVAAIPGHALMVGAAYAFGFWPAFTISLATTVLGSQLAFGIARYLGRPVVERLAPVEAVDKWYDVSSQKGLLFFMVAFMVPVFPADVMNYVAGLSALSGRRFFVANLAGRLPGVVVMSAIGAYGFQLSLQIWFGIIIFSVLMFVSWRFVFSPRRGAQS